MQEFNLGKLDKYNRFRIIIVLTEKRKLSTKKCAISREIVPHKMTKQNGNTSNQFWKGADPRFMRPTFFIENFKIIIKTLNTLINRN